MRCGRVVHFPKLTICTRSSDKKTQIYSSLRDISEDICIDHTTISKKFHNDLEIFKKISKIFENFEKIYKNPKKF